MASPQNAGLELSANITPLRLTSAGSLHHEFGEKAARNVAMERMIGMAKWAGFYARA